MWNPVSLVAKHKSLAAPERFLNFAIQNKDKYSLVMDWRSQWTVSNFHVDRLLADFECSEAEIHASTNSQDEVGA